MISYCADTLYVYFTLFAALMVCNWWRHKLCRA